MKNLLLLTLFFLTSCDVPFFKVVSSSFAKEFCSCLYVEGQSENYCKAYAKQIVPVSRYDINKEASTITAYGLGKKTIATFVDKKSGCQIKE